MSLVRRVAGRARRILGQGPAAAPPAVAANTMLAPGNQWYQPVVAGAGTFAARSMDAATVGEALSILGRLTSDKYADYVGSFYRAGLERFGASWRYADINTALLTLAAALRPERYLEIGVRCGRSLAMVGSVCPSCHIVACDMFIEGYGGMENPGPHFVQSELSKVGFKGDVDFVIGDSHKTLPAYFRSHPDAFFDLIAVDGDHTDAGALADLETVWPRLKVGGALVFDDVSNPSHPGLAAVWRDFAASRAAASSFCYGEIGFGVAFAIRHA